MASIDKPVATVDSAHLPSLPDSSATLFAAKKKEQLTFEAIAKELGREEVAVAAIFYGQAKASSADVEKLSQLLEVPHETLAEQLYGLPDRGRSVPMPPREPLIYRLYEIVQNYGYAYKAVLNEKFGDGIMSAISFSTTVKKGPSLLASPFDSSHSSLQRFFDRITKMRLMTRPETDDKGDWVVITLRGKWLPFTRF